MSVIVAKDGELPQAEREAKRFGLVALVGSTDPAWIDEPWNTLDTYREHLQTFGAMKEKDWNNWFDKAAINHTADAMDLLPALVERPRLVIIGNHNALSFKVWEPASDYRWRWAQWDKVFPGLELGTQLIATVPGPEKWNDEALQFWQGLVRAIRGGMARMNKI